ncbi:glycerophosphodiester phosphodiesterase GDPDL4 isoform X1 [Cajanus cajan]|uniref:glycerophosphodiester phosphodiesterase n=1 Tax=Cajanus cajan TaxID=3821 RepID=A0A151R5S6_CAJCA|nr:glycerophosphodiester phosphodiesterase GDPDL4 isoform X1 [Cajanus cajan]KYP37846.1 putative glycerophosphoryl diester phosphodiesterase 1 [Cajanus cajan]
MWKPRAVPRALSLFLFLLHSLVSAKGSNRTTWNTLRGSPPLVIARGGFSGIFPDSSDVAYELAKEIGLRNLIVWCDVQLTKDGEGICFPNINLENATHIDQVFKHRNSTYSVNGVQTSAYFAVDFTFKELYSNVNLVQGDSVRSDRFDDSDYKILTVNSLVELLSLPGLWLNIQHEAFYSQHNLSMKNFVLSVSRTVNVDYISSPEAGFLRSISAHINPRITKLVFSFLEKDDVDPSTNQTYGSLLKNLTSIKTFASGILVPKGYIWPVDPTSLYLLPHTSLVSDAHKAGLEVFAADFLNDVPISYNYSHDPVAECLNFIDNRNFSVDGVLSDFPLTPSEAIDCFAHMGLNAPKKVNTLVISKYGASGDYPPCTDLAYEKAISDGVDILDCPVQMAKDGIPFCLSSIDLIESTNVVRSSFSKLGKIIPEIKSSNGIYTFDLAWNDIKSLTPSMLNPYSKYSLYRNPKYNKKVEFLTLSDFLNLTKGHTSLLGVVIIIENAAYLASKENLSVTDAVIDTLSKAGYDKPGAPKVMIQSTNSSVLLKVKNKTKYELVYKIDEIVHDAVDSAISDIKRFAHSVVIQKASVYPVSKLFGMGSTKIVPKFKSSNLSVYVETFSNEFVSQAWDFMSDATVEINTFVQDAEIDGIITDFPKTANRYRRNRCLNLGNNTPPYMLPVAVGTLLQQMATLPPALAPSPPLTEAEVTEPPLPSLSKIAPSSPIAGTGPGAQPPRNAQAKVTVCFFFSSLTMLVASLLL